MASIPQNIDIGNLKKETNNPAETEAKKTTDFEVWLAFKEEDESAFIYIYQKYANLLFNYGSKFSADRELVKDCLQDFFLYLRDNRERLGNTDSIKLYLLKAFRRRVIDYVIKSDNEKLSHKKAMDFQLQIESSDELKYINAQLQKEQIEKLNRALTRLEMREKEAVYYFYYEGLGYKEISDLLGFSHVSSARRLIYRALQNLRELFFFIIYAALPMSIFQ